MEFKHEPVLLKECIQALEIKKDGIYVDGTLGGAGHSEEILKNLSENGKLIGIDRDEEALKAASKRLEKYKNVSYVHGNHDDIRQILDELNIDKVDGILLDLGVSSYQLDERARGFSYIGDGKLDMRMDTSSGITAKDVVNTYPEEKLANIIWEYGEERFSRQIAKNICKFREEKPIETTKELVQIIENSIPRVMQKDGHPAKRTFQAIRIEVNEELIRLRQTVKDIVHSLNSQGRLAIITFHSLEDKIIKHTYEELEGRCTCPKDFPVCVCGCKSYGKIITKKPIVCDENELQDNPRARSAKLRVFEKI